jgi:cell wall-associated NlpC family hydrolase
VPAVEAWLSRVRSTMQTVSTALESVAPSGGFASVLARVQAVLDAGPAGAGPVVAPGGTPSGAAAPAGWAWSAAPSALSGAMVGAPRQGATAVAPGTRTPGQVVVSEAERFLGTPYVWGGDSPSGFDCSGLVQYVYAQLGIALPRTSEEQALVGTPVPGVTAAQPGDLVFYAGSDGTPTAPGHVGIYVGNGLMIDAPYTGTDVQVDPVGDPVAIRRVLPGGAPSPTPALTSVVPGTGAAAGGAAPGGIPASLAPSFAAAASRYGLPAGLLPAVARQESGFQAGAVSSAGAEGLMQIMPGTAEGLGVTPFTPRQAIDGAASLLSAYLRRWGSIPLALAAYDAGPGAVEQYGGIPPYAQTQEYVASIMRSIGGGT